MTRTEARAAFNNDKVYMEKYLQNPRHIEIQIAGDVFGNVVSYPERDCTIQRRHQKLVEESPSPMINDRIRKKMGKAARRAARVSGIASQATAEATSDVTA